MRASNVLFSAAHLFVIFCILAMGGMCLVLPSALHARSILACLLLEEPHRLYLVGGALLLLGVLLLGGFSYLNKTRYYRLRMADHLLSIDPLFLRQLIERYWKERFSEKALLKDAAFSPSGKLELLLEMHTSSLEEQQGILERIERELGSFLAEKGGYKQEFFVTVALE